MVDPHKIVTGIIQSIILHKESRTRFTERLLPIPVACKANLDTFKQYAKPIIEEYFKDKENLTVFFDFEKNIVVCGF